MSEFGDYPFNKKQSHNIKIQTKDLRERVKWKQNL